MLALRHLSTNEGGSRISKRWVIVTSLPACNLCTAPVARYDGATKMGPWAYMCHTCHATYGLGLGTGVGQRLLLEGELEAWIKGEQLGDSTES